jgi:DNA-binding NtrC family response regulator
MATCLIVDDEDEIRWVLRKLLEKNNYTVFEAKSGEEAISSVEKSFIDVVILDIRMPGISGLEALEKILSIDSEIKVIILTALNDVKLAVEAMKKGAFDYFVKPIDNEELLLALSKAMEHKQIRAQVDYLKEKFMQTANGIIIGENSTLKSIFNLLNQVADSDITVLIMGESGTGKQVIAEKIHNMSPRRNQPFVTVDLSVIPQELIESELFGYEKGAFTGAYKRKPGKFYIAQKGTLFLDEISNLSLITQAKLLRFLETKYIEPLGSVNPIRLDVRIIAATNQNLAELVEKSLFRADLYYRLKVVSIELPPLRNRKEDIPELVNYFIKLFNASYKKHIKGISPETMQIFLNYSWPGNIRELKNYLQAAVLLANEIIEPIHLPQDFQLKLSPALEKPMSKFSTLNLRKAKEEMWSNIEREIIIEALTKAKGNKRLAARILGISFKNLYNLIHKLNIPLDKINSSSK